jgi:hypothetical protein
MTEVEGDEQTRTALRTAGQAYLDQVIVRATKGEDPFQLEPLKKVRSQATVTEDPDVAAFEYYFERNKAYVLMAIFIAAQSSSWVLMKVCINATAGFYNVWSCCSYHDHLVQGSAWKLLQNSFTVFTVTRH